MTTLPESDRHLEATYDTVNRFTVERERRQVAKAALEAAKQAAELLRGKPMDYTKPSKEELELRAIREANERARAALGGKPAPAPQPTAEQQLDRLAKARAAETGETFETAYTMILSERPDLYGRAQIEAPAPIAAVEPEPPRMGVVERRFDELARERAARTGETYEAAYVVVLTEHPGLYINHLKEAELDRRHR